MKSRKTLTTMTLAFAIVGALLITFDPRHIDGVAGGIGAGSLFLGFLSFIGLLLSLVISSLREDKK